MMEESDIPSLRMLQTRGIALQNLGSDHRKGQVKHFVNTSDARHDFPTDSSTAIPTWVGKSKSGLSGCAYKS